MVQGAPATGGQNAAPANGIVVRWRVRTAPPSAATTMKLRLLRNVTVASYTGLRSSQFESIPANGGIFTFATRLPVAAGDIIGLDKDNTALVCFGRSGDPAGARIDKFNSPLPDNATATADFVIGPAELSVNADIEADADADGFGDETQDLCPTDPATQFVCPVVTPPPNPVVTPSPDTTVPIASAKFKKAYDLRRALKAGITGRVASNEAGKIVAQATIGRATAKRLGFNSAKTVVVARGTASLAAAGNANVKLKFTNAAKRRLKNARAVKLALRFIVTDLAGNATPLSVRTKLTQ